MRPFLDLIDRYPFTEQSERILNCTRRDVERALSRERLGPGDLAALLSPAAEPRLEAMAQKAHRITRYRFGRVIQMYAPLYVSNACTNGCLYCGFSRRNRVRRRTLTQEEAEAEARLLLEAGFRHILIVSGESPRHVDTGYLAALSLALSGRFASISVEVQPLEEADYRRLAAAGVDGLVSYQETYDRAAYARFHPSGPKRNFAFRLQTAERGGAAGLRRLGIGALLGLSDWRAEGWFIGLHAAYLQKTFWQTQVSISFPRLRPTAGGFTPPHPVEDRALVQLVCALRLAHPDCGLVLSTRERPALREHLLPLGITQMSAGSRTEPGGYGRAGDAERQFEVHDTRPPAEVAACIARLGYEPVWKDWDAEFLAPRKGGDGAREAKP